MISNTTLKQTYRHIRYEYHENVQKFQRKKEKRIDCIGEIEKVNSTHTQNYNHTKRKSQSHKFTTYAQQRNEMENNNDGNGMAVGA